MPNDIIGGDYNLVLDLNKDKKRGRDRTNFNSQEIIKNWLDNHDLVEYLANATPRKTGIYLV